MSADPKYADFVGRHIGPRDEDIEKMLKVIGVDTLDEVINKTIPSEIVYDEVLSIKPAANEDAALAELKDMASRNKVYASMIGMGYYGTFMPSVIRRNVLENPGWYTSYTPYQAEISQGRLEAMLNFQTMVSDLAGLDTANASLLDEATAAAEAMTLMRRASKTPKDAVLLIDDDIFPQTVDVIDTRSEPLEIEYHVVNLDHVSTYEELKNLAGGKDVFGVIAQYPGASGEIYNFYKLADAAHEGKALVTGVADILALTLLTPPGEAGADVVVGNTQRFGVPMQFGGPHAGYMAVRKGLERNMPGRLIGVSKDADGNPGLRLAMQTREQHIRREKATSNICTAQALLAVLASMYAVYHGPAGLIRIAARVHNQAKVIASELKAVGIQVVTERFFDTLTVSVPGRASKVHLRAVHNEINVWREDENTIRLSCDETTDSATIVGLLAAFGVSKSVDEIEAAVAALPIEGEELTKALTEDWGDEYVRTSEFLTADNFNTMHSESQMMRYLRRLADLDYALDRGMIPLGSCTMKLNAATEMEPITWPEFANMHPFVPADQSQGTREYIAQLSDWLIELTGYYDLTMQPNSGAAGEYAAMVAFHKYHLDKGQPERNVCLIPESAHGTNAATAAMAGFKVAVVKNLPNGNIDVEDLKAKIAANEGKIGAIMITYPSTYGVYENTITEVPQLVKDAGGLVYIDGANMNALVGIGRPGKFGGDASHLNLHKTFAIPHGGGGPGVGPVGFSERVAPYMPNHKFDPAAGPSTSPGAVSSAPFGSANVQQITWSYLRMLGGEGLAKVTRVAVLNANYIAARLREHYPVMFQSEEGLVAHECILDLNPINRECGISVDDVAKRLIDYGFHAPTMSFPVGGTLMVEPTESEDLMEIDRFCDAMIEIRKEIQDVADGKVEAEESVLRNAPHTAASVAVEEWNHPYTREQAVFPGGMNPAHKYWPPVRRIDGAWGDRNLVCSLPPTSAYADDE